MNYYSFEKYKNTDIGYYLRKYQETSGNINRVHTLIDLSGSGFTGEPYYNDEWFTELKKSSGVNDYCAISGGGVGVTSTANSIFDNAMLTRHAHKELQPDIYDVLHYMEHNETPASVVNDFMRSVLKGVFNDKRETFKRYWRVINETYDPLYNVDVTDTETHTGTDTVTHTGTDTTDHTGDDTLKNTGDDTLEHSGTVSDAKSGKETTKDADGSQTTTNNSIYAFDVNAAIDNEKTVTELDTERELSFTNRQDTTTYNNNDKQKYNSNHKTEYNSTTETEYNTENETEYNSTITRRKYGNYGTTKSQEMVNDEIELAKQIDFIAFVVDTVARDMLLY